MISVQQHIMWKIEDIVKKHQTTGDFCLVREHFSNTGTIYVMNTTYQLFMTIRYDFQQESASFDFNDGTTNQFKVHVIYSRTGDWLCLFKTLDHQLSEDMKRILVYPGRK